MYPVVLATVPLALQQLGLALGIVALLLWLAALLSRALVLRRYAHTSALVAASKQIGLTIAALPFIAAGFLLAFNNSDGVGIIAVCVLIVFGGALFPTLRAAPRIFITDEIGVTRYWFLFKKTLPWQVIDWVYPRRKTTTTYTPLGAKVSTSTENFWVIEAGRGKKLNVPTDALGGITAKAFQPLLEMIKTRVPAQNFGYNQAAWVRARRKAY